MIETRNTKPIQVMIEADLHRDLKAACARSGKTFKKVFENAARNFVTEEERAHRRKAERDRSVLRKEADRDAIIDAAFAEDAVSEGST